VTGQQRIAAGIIGGAALAYYWKAHRVWGFLIGSLLTGAALNLVAPTDGPS
jgi:hypothetical protein